MTKKATVKSFPSEEEAQMFLTGTDPSLDPNSSSYTAKFYGVRNGKVPGVYTDWASAEKQVVGWQKPKVRCFATREEAEAFVNSPGSTVTGATEERKKHPRTATGEDAKNVTEKETSSETEITPAPKKRKRLGAELAERETTSTKLAVTTTTVEEYEPESRQPSVDGPSDESEEVTEEEETVEHKSSKPRSSSRKNSILRIYTDGSALGNGRDAAIAGVGVWFGDRDARNISEPLTGPRQTNQRAELTAILRAINVAPLHREVQIFTDSQYAINCVTVWCTAWMKNNWMTSLGRPVDNQDLIEQILDKIKEREEFGSMTKFEWVRGHTGQSHGNTQADRLAVQGAKMARSVK
ncbi:hypothetical protein RUND412_000994 [Rhizina undulata]